MKQETLDQEKLSIEQQFSTLQTERTNLQQRIAEIDKESAMLAGEHRAIVRLSESLKVTKEPKKRG